MVRIEMADSHIIIKGHAGFSKPGTDIVCAAVSALGQTLKHIDELYREYEVYEGKNEEDSILRVDFHDPKDLIKAFAVERHEYLENQLKKNKKLSNRERYQIKEELSDWENVSAEFAQKAMVKGLIIQNQVALIVEGMKEIAKDYPEHVEIVELVEDGEVSPE